MYLMQPIWFGHYAITSRQWKFIDYAINYFQISDFFGDDGVFNAFEGHCACDAF
jgi:hypothetical protein